MYNCSSRIKTIVWLVLATSFTPSTTGYLSTIDVTTGAFRRRHHYKIPSSSVSALNVQPPTIQDEQVDSPASVVFYDDVLDDDIPNGVVCARGVCVLADFDDDFEGDNNIPSVDDQSIVDKVLNSYLGPRALLAFASILYGTNFPLGAIMNEALPPSAATSSRMVLAAMALSPFLPKLSPKLAGSALLCGCFTALGYTTQSLALVDVSPATVAFLGAVTVVVCPQLSRH